MLSCTVWFNSNCLGNFLDSLFSLNCRKGCFLLHPNGIFLKRHASGDKDIFNVFMLAHSINSSLKKYNIGWLQLQVKLVLII